MQKRFHVWLFSNFDSVSYVPPSTRISFAREFIVVNLRLRSEVFLDCFRISVYQTLNISSIKGCFILLYLFILP